MADEEKQPPADDQPAAEGGDAAAEETSPPAPEAQADQEVTEGDAPAEPPPAEPADEPAPVEAIAAPDEPEPAAADAPADEAPAEAAAEEQRRQRPPRPDADEERQPEVVPGAHLEPDLVLEEARQAGADDEFGQYATADDDSPIAEGEEAASVEDAPPTPTSAARTPLDLAADARYRATGKRKRAVARVILKPGEGTYTINGRELDAYFPRASLQRHARQPLETTGNQSRMDVVAKIHGGGVSAQAIALRHGIARALVEADPNLRGDLKRQGLLTRDARVKERKKAGLKKARKRPQFSKR
jgi:small subunit ribosomal protein S9